MTDLASGAVSKFWSGGCENASEAIRNFLSGGCQPLIYKHLNRGLTYDLLIVIYHLSSLHFYLNIAHIYLNFI